MRFKIAVVQFEIKQFSPEENLEKAEKFIREAVVSKAKIVVFPEDFITGPIAGRREFADSENKYRKYFQQLARKYKIDIVPGSIIEEEKSKLYNTTYYIDSSGKVKARYRKINLWLPERKYLTPGNEISVFNTKYGKVGLIICWDLAFPEIFRKMAMRGVNMVICPSYWSHEEKSFLFPNINSEAKIVDSLCVTRAFENEIILVYSNAAGKAKVGKRKLTLIGHFQIAVPSGAIKKLEHNKEEMFIQEVDTAILKATERECKIRKDLKSRTIY
jgi:predicted amidohydrolase